MNTIRVDVLNPKAMRLLKDLAALNLISIQESSANKGFANVLKKLRSKATISPSLEEITQEVELVREKRYRKNEL
ncbi:MAG: hypothetical protein ACOVOW_16055 [Spirosomataceae bacterium]|jgi:hypothetical protein